MTLNATQRSAVNDFQQELQQFQQQLQSKCYSIAQQLDPQQASSLIQKSYDASSSLKGQASHASRSGSSLSGSPVEQLNQIFMAIQEDISQAVTWAQQQVSQS